MKKRLRAVALLCVLWVFLGLAGCGGIGFPPGNEEEAFQFFRLSQDERKAYVADDLHRKYGETFEVSEVRQRQINVFFNEDEYFATARCPARHYTVSVWVTNEGVITDSGFVMALTDDIEKLFTELLKDDLDSFKLTVYTEFLGKPDRVWTSGDDLMQMLKSPGVHCYVKLFVGKDFDTGDAFSARMTGKLCFADCTLYVHKVDDPAAVDLSCYDWQSYDLRLDIDRAE